MLEQQTLQPDQLQHQPQNIPNPNQPTPQKSLLIPVRNLTQNWLTISRPQYKRTCGLSSLVSIWNFQFSKLGLGTKQPISIQQAMLKLNLIGNGSVQENFRRKFKKTVELTDQKGIGVGVGIEEENQDPQIINNDKSLQEYIDMVDFGCFTGNDTLLKWYRILCRMYGGSGRSYIFYKTNSERSLHQNQQSAKRALVQGLNSSGKTCFIYHAYDHYFCPVGYEFTPASGQSQQNTFESQSITLEDNLCVLVGQPSKMFNCIHSFNWSDIQLDLTTYWPKKFNIRRPKQGITIAKGKEQAQSKNSTINCIMAFQKLSD